MKYNSTHQYSFKEVFDSLYIPLNCYALNFLQNKEEAEDLVQEVFVDVWEKVEKFKTVKELKPYLYKMVRNRCLNLIKDKQRKAKKLEGIGIELSEESILNAIIKEEVYQQLNATLDELPPQCRKIYKLFLEGQKASEIAETLNLSVETIKTQKKKAKKILREKLGNLTYLLLLTLVNMQ